MTTHRENSANRRPLRGFDFTAAMRLLCGDIVSRLPEFAHVDLGRIAISFCQSRKGVPYGRQASLTPLRFADGANFTLRRGVRYTCQSVRDADGREYLYILSFYLPRFLNHPLSEKLSTVVHELWHISPRFDGDIRRHAGRCYAHGSSHEKYDAQMDALAEKWLGLKPPAAVYEFLTSDFQQLANQHGGVHGIRIPAPKLVPLPSATRA